VIGDSTLFIGQVVVPAAGRGRNLPFAAAFSLVPIVGDRRLPVVAERLGAFDAL
jgi:putative spermidine/putrescine transport system permease protein